jgi:hypothetical protein
VHHQATAAAGDDQPGDRLPAATTAQHWSLAWTGLDFAKAVMALVTAVLLTIRSPQASLAGAATWLAIVLTRTNR